MTGSSKWLFATRIVRWAVFGRALWICLLENTVNLQHWANLSLSCHFRALGWKHFVYLKMDDPPPHVAPPPLPVLEMNWLSLQKFGLEESPTTGFLFVSFSLLKNLPPFILLIHISCWFLFVCVFVFLTLFWRGGNIFKGIVFCLSYVHFCLGGSSPVIEWLEGPIYRPVWVSSQAMKGLNISA